MLFLLNEKNKGCAPDFKMGKLMNLALLEHPFSIGSLETQLSLGPKRWLGTFSGIKNHAIAVVSPLTRLRLRAFTGVLKGGCDPRTARKLKL